jgi:hypothetical protein
VVWKRDVGKMSMEDVDVDVGVRWRADGSRYCRAVDTGTAR